jgi:pimeloyl-ACP methyl ester carboxylesterase
MYVELCMPSAGTRAVQVRVTPSASNHAYWDPSFEPDRYSYVQALNAARFATLSIDPIGSGRSQHPPSARVTVGHYVVQLHHLIGLLRGGKIGGRAFEAVITNGLSNGSLEASRYRDVDGVILTGYTSPVNAKNLALEAGPNAQLARTDPRYAALHLGPGYISFKPDFWQRVLLSADGYDPAMRAAAGEQQDTTTVSYLGGIGLGIARNNLLAAVAASRRITAPVLVAAGGEDMLMCGTSPFGADCTNAATLRRSVTPFYPATSRLDTFVLPRAGHAMNLARNAPDWFAFAIGWSQQVVG